MTMQFMIQGYIEYYTMDKKNEDTASSMQSFQDGRIWQVTDTELTVHVHATKTSTVILHLQNARASVSCSSCCYKDGKKYPHISISYLGTCACSDVHFYMKTCLQHMIPCNTSPECEHSLTCKATHTAAFIAMYKVNTCGIVEAGS